MPVRQNAESYPVSDNQPFLGNEIYTGRAGYDDDDTVQGYHFHGGHCGAQHSADVPAAEGVVFSADADDTRSDNIVACCVFGGIFDQQGNFAYETNKVW